jgi:hypothetical protein
MGGSRDKAYNSLVPFEEGTVDYAALKAHAKNDDSYLSGPEDDANVVLPQSEMDFHAA